MTWCWRLGKKGQKADFKQPRASGYLSRCCGWGVGETRPVPAMGGEEPSALQLVPDGAWLLSSDRRPPRTQLTCGSRATGQKGLCQLIQVRLGLVCPQRRVGSLL